MTTALANWITPSKCSLRALPPHLSLRQEVRKESVALSKWSPHCPIKSQGGVTVQRPATRRPEKRPSPNSMGSASLNGSSVPLTVPVLVRVHSVIPFRR
jgi:hypothetical protein